MILLCAGTFVTGVSVHTKNNGPVKSQEANEKSSKEQDHLALPSQNSYQNVVAPSNKYLSLSRPSYQVNPAVIDTISEAASSNQVQYGSPKAQHPTVTVSASIASDPSSSEYNNILNRYVPAVQPIRPYDGGPIAVKTVSVESQQTGNAGYITRPVVYTNNAAQSAQYITVPATQTVESQRTVQIHPPSSQGSQYVAPAVVPTNSPPKPFYPASPAILESHGEFRVQSQAAPLYQVQQLLAVPPSPQPLPAPKLIYNVNPVVKSVPVSVPVAPKKVTVESYSSVSTHPSPAPKHAPAPIPVPVIYQQLETNYPAGQQLVLTKAAPTAATYAQVPVGVQAIQVPVYTNGARLQYHQVPVNGGYQQGYARAVVYSPASEVSRVTFNGLGVSYGW